MKFFILLLSVMMITEVVTAQPDPKNDWAYLKKYAESNKELKNIKAGDKRVIFMGDSNTEFWKSDDSLFFLKSIYINRGISGQTTSQMLVRFRQDVIDLHPKAVVILAGINDIAENNGPITLKEITGNIISMVELARVNKIEPIVCSVLPANNFPWRPSVLPAEKVIQLNELLKEYCKKMNVMYVDYYSKMVNKEAGLDKVLSGDGVHPTKEGYKIMESIIKPAIYKALKK